MTPSTTSRTHSPIQEYADLAIMTILPETDQAIRNIFGLTDRTVRDGYEWAHGKLLSGTVDELVVVSGMPLDRENVPAAQFATKFLDSWRPAAFLLVDIGGGVSGRDQINLGDVVTHTVLHYYDFHKTQGDGGDSPRHLPLAGASALLRELSRRSETRWADVITRHIHAARPTPGTPKVMTGEMLSGGAILSDGPRLRRLLDLYPKVLMVEMEGVGAARAVHDWSLSGTVPEFLVIRGVSDFCNDDQANNQTTRDSWKKYAAEAAAAHAHCVGIEYAAAQHARTLLRQRPRTLIDAHRGARSQAEFAAAVAARAEDASNRLLLQMTHSQKYLKSLSIPRRTLTEDLKEFYQSQSKAYALIAPSGTGKTTAMCEQIDSGALGITLFYSGSFLYSTDTDKACDILSRVRSDLSLPATLSKPEVVSMIDELSRVWKMPLVIVIDGVNEYQEPGRLLESVNEIVELSGRSNIKIIVSCRDHSWKELIRTRKPYTSAFFNLTADDLPRRQLSGFTIDELQQVYENYRKEYDLRTTYQGLSSVTRAAFENPLILRIAAMAFQGRQLPDNVPEGSIFDVFYAERIRTDRDVERFIRKIVDGMRRLRRDRLPSNRVDDVLSSGGYKGGDPANPLQKLLELGILYEYEDGALEVTRFVYDRFFEYLLGRALLEEAVSQQLDGILLEASEFPSLRKGLESAVLAYDRKGDLLGPTIVSRLAANASSIWREVAATCAGQMRSNSTSIRDVIWKLSTDDDYWVRWVTAHAVRSWTLSESDNRGEMSQLATSLEWQSREVIAIAVGSWFDRPQEALRVLEILALDEHWRVRRVVAFSFGELVGALEDAEAWIQAWAGHADWRVREALARSPRPLTRMRPELARAVASLAGDAEPIVRRAVARSMRLLAQMSSEVSAPTLLGMAGDADAWVRKTVMKSLASPVMDALLDQQAALSGFSKDEDANIRWALLRSLRRLQNRAEIVDIVSLLTKDLNSYVRAAADFSLILYANPNYLSGDSIPEMDAFTLLHHSNEIVYELSQDTGRLRKHREDATKNWVADDYLAIETAISDLVKHISGSEQFWPILDRLSKDEDEGLRWGVASLLAKTDMGNDQRIILLGTLAADDHYWIRRAVAETIARLTKDDAREANDIMVQLTLDESDEVLLQVAATCVQMVRSGAANSDLFAAIVSLKERCGRDQSQRRQEIAKVFSDA